MFFALSKSELGSSYRGGLLLLSLIIPMELALFSVGKHNKSAFSKVVSKLQWNIVSALSFLDPLRQFLIAAKQTQNTTKLRKYY
jgi:hypothetical protein